MLRRGGQTNFMRVSAVNENRGGRGGCQNKSDCKLGGWRRKCGVSEMVRVKSPPPMPLLIFDGECGFCRRWVGRWKNATGEAVTYLPLQDPAVATQFPEIPREDMEESIHLVLPDGSVYYGAEAVFRSLAAGGRERWLLRLY